MKVLKRNGAMEDFDRSKVVAGLLKAGANPTEAESVTSQVETWVNGLNLDVVSSTDIAKRLVEVLKAVNPTAAAAFEGYVKPDSTQAPSQPPSQPVQ
jgi:transcriptional regulator NrdR family protein